MRTAELTGVALDWAVVKASGTPVTIEYTESGKPVVLDKKNRHCTASRTWAQGGSIIEREKIQLFVGVDGWLAKVHGRAMRMAEGQTPLIAAMRCYVFSRLGDDVDIPEELK